MSTRSRTRSLLAAVAAAVTVAATGSAASASTAPGAAPSRIVSLSPSSTEVLFAIGAGDQVVAVGSLSNYPEDAPLTDLSAYEPNLEAIADYEPDLVVVDGTSRDLIEELETVGIPVHIASAPADLDELYAGIEAMGAATGNAAGAAGVVDGMRAEVAAILERVPELGEPLTFYHELDDTLYSITSATFIGQLYSLAGLENIADATDPEGTSADYPQLGTEYLLEADPDLVFLADTKCCAETAETFAARPGFGALTAVRNGDIVLLDDDIASRWGPRVVVLLDIIVTAVEDAVAGAAVEATAA